MDERAVPFVMGEKGEGERGGGRENRWGWAPPPAAMFSVMLICERCIWAPMMGDWLSQNCLWSHIPRGFSLRLEDPGSGDVWPEAKSRRASGTPLVPDLALQVPVPQQALAAPQHLICKRRPRSCSAPSTGLPVLRGHCSVWPHLHFPRPLHLLWISALLHFRVS